MAATTKEMEMKKYIATVAGFALVALLAGCSPETSDPTEPIGSTTPSSKYQLMADPGGAGEVIKVRKKAKDQEEIVIVGRIGGSENPWVEGRGAFSIVDSSLKSCLECGSEGCPKPWDYC